MHRFHCSDASLDTPVIRVTDPREIHHIKTVLRLKKGDRIAVFNGNGEEAEGPIISLGPDQIEMKPERHRSRGMAVRAPIILACAIPKKAKFELIIEKTTELGVDEIIPLVTSRTEVRLDPARAKRKLERFQTVAVNAAKQCQRSSVPTLHPVRHFSDFIPTMGPDTLILIPCLEGERKNLLDVLPRGIEAKKILFLIGPEGDFTPDEITLAVKYGGQPVSLGPTTLKVDTAAITVVAVAGFLLAK